MTLAREIKALRERLGALPVTPEQGDVVQTDRATLRRTEETDASGAKLWRDDATGERWCVVRGPRGVALLPPIEGGHDDAQ